MKAGRCPVCRRLKILVPTEHGSEHFVLRMHSAETDLSRFKARYDGPITTELCLGSRRVPLSQVGIPSSQPAPA